MSLALKGFGSTTIVSADVSIDMAATVDPNGNTIDDQTIVLAIPLRQEVYQSGDNLPIVGSRAVEMQETSHNVEGFEHDRRRWVDDDQINSRNPGSAGGLTPRPIVTGKQ